MTKTKIFNLAISLTAVACATTRVVTATRTAIHSLPFEDKLILAFAFGPYNKQLSARYADIYAELRENPDYDRAYKSYVRALSLLSDRDVTFDELCEEIDANSAVTVSATREFINGLWSGELAKVAA